MFAEAHELCQDICSLEVMLCSKVPQQRNPKGLKAFGFISADVKPNSKQVEIFNIWTTMLLRLTSPYFSRYSSLKDFKDIHLELFYYLQTIHAGFVEEVYLFELINQAFL